MMRRCMTKTAASPTPFVEVVRGLEGLEEAQQTAAAKVLMEFFPNGLDEALPFQLTFEFGSHADQPQAPARIEVRGGLELIRVPGGRARLGSTASEFGHRPDEAPVHEVELDDFYIAPTPVTNADYARYLRCNPDAPIPRYWSDRRFNQPEQPVVGVSWAEAEAYCEWAGLALPTEAQWEHACRAGATTRFCAGDDEAALARVGWYLSNAEAKLHVVRTRDPDELGLFDMHGNVREWCRDEFGSYQVAPRPGDGLRHPPREDGSRVHRGGSFRDSAEELRCAARRQALASYRLDALGFRPIASIASGD
jgi:formylglycine-generating enzyme required for sulfatase activity